MFDPVFGFSAEKTISEAQTNKVLAFLHTKRLKSSFK
jgi:hypothetical protein